MVNEELISDSDEWKKRRIRAPAPDASGYVRQSIDYVELRRSPVSSRSRGSQRRQQRTTVLAVGRAQLSANPRCADSRSAEDGHRARNRFRYGGVCHLLC